MNNWFWRPVLYKLAPDVATVRTRWTLTDLLDAHLLCDALDREDRP